MTSLAPLSDEEALPRALSRWSLLAGARVEPLGTGLINRTYRVIGTSGAFVLQRINPIFDPAIHDNIEAVTRRLVERGVTTPLLIPADGGALCVRVEGGGGLWRLMTLVEGTSFDTISDPAQARSAAHLVGRFHAALDDLDHAFAGLRLGVHDTPRHLAALRSALDEERAHRLHAAAAPLGIAVLAAASSLLPLPDLPPRVCHGDLKFNNVLFEGASGDAAHRALALVDLDTVGPMALAYELGDAWRSWCNPLGEDHDGGAGGGRFDLEVFAASLAGYTEGLGRPLSLDERRALLGGPEWISLELSARFCADALRERYFGWDPKRFATRGDHNLRRARSQWSLHEATVACRAERARLLGLD